MHRTLISPDIIDRIYEAAVIPERWATICDILAEQSNSYAGAFIAIDGAGGVNWTASERAVDLIGTISRSEFGMSDVRPKRHIERAPFAFLPDAALMTQDDLDSDKIYNRFLRPAGLGHTAGDVIQEPSGHTIIFDIIRRTENGPFASADIDRLNALRPDLARAALMASRLAFRRMQDAVATLSAIDLPAAVVTLAGSVRVMNRQMEELAPRLSTGGHDRFRVANAGTQTLLERSLAELRSNKNPGLQSIAVPFEEGSPAMILHLLPVTRDARDIFSHATAIIIASPVSRNGPIDQRVVRGLFDLTSMEARVAAAIASGMTIDEITQAFGNSRETVRTHLKRVFSKTGVKSQAQLASLLSGVHLPRNAAK